VSDRDDTIRAGSYADFGRYNQRDKALLPAISIENAQAKLPEIIGEISPGEEEEAIVTIHEQAMTKIQQLPESLAQEVSDFIDLLLVKQDQKRWDLWTHFSETLTLVEGDFSDYLRNLEAYEERLAKQ
jgi:hypothetical protein